MAVFTMLYLAIHQKDENEQNRQAVFDRESRRWDLIIQQQADVDRCRELGGIPATAQADYSYPEEYKRKLVSCEFPCDKRPVPVEK